MMVIPPLTGLILILFGILLFIVDLSLTNHGLLTAGGIVTLLAGALALLGAGVPYSGVLLGAIVVVAMVMGGVLIGKEGMIGEGGVVRRAGGVERWGWVFVHGELWRAELAFAPEQSDLRDTESVVGVGSKVRVVGFGEGGVVQVVPTQLPARGQDLEAPG